MNSSETNNIILSVVGFAIIGAVGYWAYQKYLKKKVDSAVTTSKFLGIF